MTDETHPVPLVRKNMMPEAILAACIAAFTALAVAAVTWYSAERALQLSIRESCIKKIDQAENDLRTKTGAFLALQAKWLTVSENPKFDIDEYFDAGGKAIAAAQDLSVNSPLRFAWAATMAGDSIRQRMTAKTEKEKAAVIKELKDGKYDLFKFFFQEIDVFDSQRAACDIGS
ncbi:hypothetical protein GIW46_17755 [Pseudomonas syringae]|uniref:hypothetical protein n=1 Tax=Pseudomonas syringae TaxID=317 RepID=UPI002FD999C4|nr:hypothetical protein [Pseudomonas syringae]